MKMVSCVTEIFNTFKIRLLYPPGTIYIFKDICLPIRSLQSYDRTLACHPVFDSFDFSFYTS